MRVAVSEARRRFREVLDAAIAGEVVEIERRGQVVARIVPAEDDTGSGQTYMEWITAWRERWGVADWPDDDPFAGLRDPSPGPPPLW